MLKQVIYTVNENTYFTNGNRWSDSVFRFEISTIDLVYKVYNIDDFIRNGPKMIFVLISLKYPGKKIKNWFLIPGLLFSMSIYSKSTMLILNLQTESFNLIPFSR